MAQIIESIHPTLPVHWDGNFSRVLGRIRTNKPKAFIKPYSDSNPIVDFTKVGAYDRYQQNVPILDQQQVGSCVAHGTTSAALKCRDLQGMTYVALSPDFLYAFIDGGTDGGSDPADAITALEKTGIGLLSDVPDNFILESDISAQAKQNALRFLLDPNGVYQCSNFAEMTSADYLGFAITLTVNVGGDFTPDSNGIVNFTPGVANHCVSGGEAVKILSDGTIAYRFRNSWNTTWGLNGCAWITAEHIDQQPQVEIFALKWFLSDPQDPNNPPS